MTDSATTYVAGSTPTVRHACARRCRRTKCPAAVAARSTSIPRRRSGSIAMAEKGWTVPTWPVKYGGAGLDNDSNAGAAGRTAPHQRAARVVRHGHQHDRPGAARIRYRRTEGRTSAEDRARTDLVVPGLQRTERRLRPREPEDERRRTRRRIRHQRLEDLDVRRRSRRLDFLSGAHRPESAETRRHHVHPVRHRSARRHGETDSADQRHVAVLRNVLRQRAGAEEERRRRSEQRLDRREAVAAVRTHVDRRHRRRHAAGDDDRGHREELSRRRRRSHRRCRPRGSASSRIG